MVCRVRRDISFDILLIKSFLFYYINVNKTVSILKELFLSSQLFLIPALETKRDDMQNSNKYIDYNFYF